MTGQIDFIDLSKILLDDFFNIEEEDMRLTRNIEKNRLDEPLTVEGPVNGFYVLVDGYKRYRSLKSLGWTTVQCKIEPVSDIAHRIIKRLRWDLNKKKMKSSERIRYVHLLISLNWSSDMIAQKTGIARDVIKKYMKIHYIPQEYKDIINSWGLGHEALLALDRMQKRLPRYTFYQIVDVLNHQTPHIFGYHIEAIEYLSKVEEFRRLPESSVRRSIDKTIIHKTFKLKEAQDIVNIEAVAQGIIKNEAAIGQYLDYVKTEAAELERILSPNLMINVPQVRRKELILIFENCLGKVNSTYRGRR
ncbi:ParB/RepB/Spo0J family partition protein [Desulfosporosinus sp. SB140]|uniref:ParB/RepB/Spo0J family partition protein n=1 Tax=Desulfosporosinus paludis TaxID=3115649 RepID=UPI00388F9DDC